MADLLVCKEKLLAVVALYRKKYELSKEVGEDYYEPGMMENLGQYSGNYNEGTGQIEICCESKGMRYENRTMNLEFLLQRPQPMQASLIFSLSVYPFVLW